MTRKDYVTLATALGDALHHIQVIRHKTKEDRHLSEAAFWYTVETVSEYLVLNNKAFDENLFKDSILQFAKIGATK